jgi:uncharacterized membrane-anchored protein YjiN (DUF445 family)
MSDATDITQQHDRALAELLEVGMAAAREVQGRLLAAQDAKEVCELSLAFNRVSRAVRQTIALQAKLGRERKRDARDDAVQAKASDEARRSLRKEQVKAAVERAIWTEAEDDEAERLIDELDDLVGEEALYEGFAQEAVEAHIARLSAELGLAHVPPESRTFAAPVDGEPDGEGTGPPAARWRSSA